MAVLLVAEARKSGLDKDPTVQRQVAAAEDRALQTAMLNKEVGPSVTDEAVHARYDQDIAGKPGEEEVHAKHILVDNEAEAKKIIAQLKDGGDFAALAKQYSKDPSGAQQGGDLGFFKKDEMVPEFATAAFALQPGQVSPEPVHTQFGWHVILLVERRRAEPPSFDQAHDELRQKMIQEGVQKAVAKARASASVEKFNLDGSQVRRHRHRRTAARAKQAINLPCPRKRSWTRPSRRLPCRCRNCRRSPACDWAPRRPASATRDATTW